MISISIDSCTVMSSNIFCFKAQAEVKERERELSQRDDVIKTLSHGRDNLKVTLRQHGLEVDREVSIGGRG